MCALRQEGFCPRDVISVNEFGRFLDLVTEITAGSLIRRRFSRHISERQNIIHVFVAVDLDAVSDFEISNALGSANMEES